MNKIGKFIKRLRKEKGLTQTQLAEKLNISFQAISKWENGETLPDTNILLSLSNELGITVDTLLNGGEIININRKMFNFSRGFITRNSGFKFFKEACFLIVVINCRNESRIF